MHVLGEHCQIWMYYQSTTKAHVKVLQHLIGGKEDARGGEGGGGAGSRGQAKQDQLDSPQMPAARFRQQWEHAHGFVGDQ